MSKTGTFHVISGLYRDFSEFYFLLTYNNIHRTVAILVEVTMKHE